MQGVYQIRNLISKKRYIGSSISLNDRKDEHFKNLRNNCHSNEHLQNSYNKHGESKFIFEIIEQADNLNRDELYELEQFYIDSFSWDSLYNINKNAKGGGSDSLFIPVLLLDLDGNIVGNFESIQSCSRYLNKSQISSNKLNKDSLISGQYRIITHEFYEENFKEISSWRNKLKDKIEEEEKALEYKKLYKDIYLDYEDLTYKFETLQDASNFVNLSKERVRQILASSWSINQQYKFYYLVDRELKYENQFKLTEALKDKPVKTKYDQYYKFDEDLDKWIVFTEDEIIAEVNNKKEALMISRCVHKALNE